MGRGNSSRPTSLPFIKPQDADLATDSNGNYGYEVGGIVLEYSAGAALNVGDVVYVSAANAVNKSNTAATTLGKLAGVVVGGKQTYGEVITRKTDVGVLAANTGESVLVMILGKFWVVSDGAVSAGAILAAGTTTAGRAKSGTITTDTVAGSSGNIIGVALEVAGAAGTTILANIHLM